MKKGTRALRNFNHSELSQIFQAMHLFRAKLEELDKNLFDIAYMKLAKSKSLNNCISLVLDGMEMTLISKALRFKADSLMKKKHYLAAIKYVEYAQVIDEEKYLFQKENGPKIKAPTAPTVSATTHKVG